MALLDETYTLSQLRDYIRSRLSGSVWRLEGMGNDSTNLIDQAISDAVMSYSRRVPRYAFEVLVPNGGKSYKLQNPGFGVFRVDFISQSVIPGVLAGLNWNLTGVNTLTNTTGAGEISQFLSWQRSFQRVTTNDPHYFWDDDAQLLYVKAVSFQRACVYTLLPRNFEQVRLIHKDLIKRLSLAHAKYQLGVNRRKFNGTIQGPGGTPITLDAEALITEANTELEALNAELKGIQPRAIPVWD